MNKFLLACDKFKPEMHLKQPGFTYWKVYADRQYRFYLQKRTW